MKNYLLNLEQEFLNLEFTLNFRIFNLFFSPFLQIFHPILIKHFRFLSPFQLSIHPCQWLKPFYCFFIFLHVYLNFYSSSSSLFCGPGMFLSLDRPAKMRFSSSAMRRKKKLISQKIENSTARTNFYSLKRKNTKNSFHIFAAFHFMLKKALEKKEFEACKQFLSEQLGAFYGGYVEDSSLI